MIEQHLNDLRPDDRILPLLEDLLALYRGSFVPDDPAEWAIVERQRLKALFVNTIQKSARLGMPPSSRLNGLCRAICGRTSGI